MNAELRLPDGRAGQALALGMAVIVVAAFWFGIVNPLVAWYVERADVVAQRHGLATHLERQAASVPVLLQQAQAMAAGAASGAAHLAGATDAIAGAVLQERLHGMARRAGAVLISLESIPVETVSTWRRIGVHVTLTASWPALLGLLHSIGAASPHLMVGDITVHGTPFVTSRTEQPLDAALTVIGFRAAGATPGADTSR